MQGVAARRTVEHFPFMEQATQLTKEREAVLMAARLFAHQIEVRHRAHVFTAATRAARSEVARARRLRAGGIRQESGSALRRARDEAGAQRAAVWHLRLGCSTASTGTHSPKAKGKTKAKDSKANKRSSLTQPVDLNT